MIHAIKVKLKNIITIGYRYLSNIVQDTRTIKTKQIKIVFYVY